MGRFELHNLFLFKSLLVPSLPSDMRFLQSMITEFRIELNRTIAVSNVY